MEPYYSHISCFHPLACRLLTLGESLYLIVEASVFDVNGQSPYTDTFKGLTVPPKTTTTVGNVPLFTSINDHPMYFLLLKCLTSSGKLISRNFYWLYPVGGSYSQLAGEFRTHKIPIKTSATCTVNGDSYLVNIRVGNANTKSDAAVAFGLYFTVIDADSKALEKRILPVTYSDNWFSLVPNEALDVQVAFKVGNNKVRPKLLLRGWNVADTEISVP
jgi:mannosylglycoprotein endo-beta-mannosidase